MSDRLSRMDHASHLRCYVSTLWNRSEENGRKTYCCVACQLVSIDSSAINEWSINGRNALCPICRGASLCCTDIFPTDMGQEDVVAELHFRWYGVPGPQWQWRLDDGEHIRSALLARDWISFQVECDELQRKHHLTTLVYVLARFRLNMEANDPLITVIEVEVLRRYCANLAARANAAMNSFQSQKSKLREVAQMHTAHMTAVCNSARLALASEFGNLRAIDVRKGYGCFPSLSGMTDQSITQPGLGRGAALKHWGGRLDSALKSIARQSLQSWRAALITNPKGATGTLYSVLADAPLGERLLDGRIIECWETSSDIPLYALIAARGAENFALSWVSVYLACLANSIEDTSRLQITAPSDLRWQHGDIHVVYPNYDRFYDVKNTVRSRKHAELTVQRKPQKLSTNISYIGVQTDGWISRDEASLARDALVSEASADRNSLLVSFENINLSILGVFDSCLAQEVKCFARENASNISLPHIDLWASDAQKSGLAKILPFLFTMPCNAWNPAFTLDDHVLSLIRVIAQRARKAAASRRRLGG
jgi:hypothetical protein